MLYTLPIRGLSLAGIAGSNSVGGMDMFFLRMLCVVVARGLMDGPITRTGECQRIFVSDEVQQ